MKSTTNETFESDIIGNKFIIVEFSAQWCAPCKAMIPILEEIDSENDTVTVLKVNIDEEIDLSSRFGIRSIPTTLYYIDGKLEATTIGFQTKDKILEKFQK